MARRRPTYDGIKDELRELWEEMTIRDSWTGAIERRARKIVGNRARYSEVEGTTGVPWWMIGAIHSMESGLRFDRHLHNGDSLKKRTWRVPRGRPRTGSPPFTWEESAHDAIRQKGWHKVESWPIERVLFETERYNGFGYRMYRGIKSPYLWSGSRHYSRGKYVADGKWSRTAVSGQTGAACLMRRIMELTQETGQPVVAPLPEPKPVPEPVPIEEEENSDVPVPKAAEPEDDAPIKHTIENSRTLWGILAAMLASIVGFIQDTFQVLIDAAAKLTEFEPAKDLMVSLGANLGSITFGLAMFALVYAASKRLEDAVTGKNSG
jgi:lysozyme family protein